ncbi:MAG: hypothetical protein P4M02_02950, partial [Clostridia bacterium]|nr:hypothetical protein [Clostridia bacterium]
RGPREHGDCHSGHHGAGGMNQLAKLTGMSIKDLTAKYPQQTSWQIALKLGKLSALKSAVLAEQKAMFDKMASDGMITADDSKKMYADLEKRVAAIDGKNTVILGRPGYMPQFSGERSGRGEAPHASSEPAA